jgi:pimeloyl-ACP methyl ester carboxylesterase
LCKREDFSFLGADYYGVGRSSGKFSDGSISRWTEDTIKLIEKVTRGGKGKGGKGAVLVGHGMGAWISFLIARSRPELVSGIVGLSADPDFTEELLWQGKATGLSEQVKAAIMREGAADITWGTEVYTITKGLIEDGRKNLLLAGGPGALKVACPVRLVHALQDEEVPFSLALRLIDCCNSKDASLVLMKGSSSGHAMEGEKEFRTMRAMILEVVEASQERQFDLRSPGSG